MARFTFGGTSSDFTFAVKVSGSDRLLKLEGAVLTFYTAHTGGSQVTDLLLNGTPVTSITTGADGQIPAFEGPEGMNRLWADAGADRELIVAQGIPGPQGDIGPQGPPGPGIGGGAWQPATAYAASQVVQAPDGSIIKRIAAGTSRATFDDTEEDAWSSVASDPTTVDGKALEARQYVRAVVSTVEPDDPDIVWFDTGSENTDTLAYAYRWRSSTGQTVPNDTDATVDFNNETSPSGWWDDAAKAWTVPEDGRYAIEASVLWVGSAAGSRLLRLRQAGSANRDIANNLVPGVAALAGSGVLGQPQTVTVQTTSSLAAGDKISVIARQTSGGGLDVKASVGVTRFTIRKLGG